MEWFYEALHYENNLPSSHLSLLISKRRTEKIANSWQLAKTGKSAWKEVKFTNLKRMIRNAENQRLTKSTKVSRPNGRADPVRDPKVCHRSYPGAVIPDTYALSEIRRSGPNIIHPPFPLGPINL
ncbi:hypothetical protein QE152_g22698 [Popillia japonica]|uniref:Uncharacterized protein n=1 Tax=Popillia japonica TaxID=7064 RepID=A0AAW1KJL8_POPJA